MDDQNDSEYNGPLHDTGGGIMATLRCRLVNPIGETTLEEVKTRLDKAYESGIPFFTKERIRYAWEEIKREPGYGGKVFTKDIHGEMVECDVLTGEIRSMGQEDGIEIQYICKELILSYSCRACFTGHIRWRTDCEYDPEWSALSPISISHEGYRLNNKTKEVLLPALTWDFEFVDKSFQDKVQEWNESQACEKLKSILSSSAKDHEINKALGFALGGLSKKRTEDDGSPYLMGLHRSASQHGLLLTLKEWLQNRDHQEQVPCYSQDPWYNSMDRQILGEAGIEVIDDPRGWLEVDEQSMMISVAPNVPVKEIITDIARPAVIVWCRVGFEDGLVEGLTDPNSSRVRAMVEGYELHEFSPDQELFSDVALYIRKSKTAVAPNVSPNGVCS